MPQRDVADAMRQQPQSQDPAAQSGRLRFQGGTIQSVRAAEPLRSAVRVHSEPIQQFRVIAEQLRSPCQGCGNAGTEFGFQRRQYGLTYPDPGKPTIRVVWVLPRFEPELDARLLSRFPAEVQEWPQQMAGSRRHAGQRSAAGATGQAKQ